MASDLHNFHVADYIVFGGMLLISIAIGIYYLEDTNDFKLEKQWSEEECSSDRSTHGTKDRNPVLCTVLIYFSRCSE
jgi:hypothetical protein